MLPSLAGGARRDHRNQPMLLMAAGTAVNPLLFWQWLHSVAADAPSDSRMAPLLEAPHFAHMLQCY